MKDDSKKCFQGTTIDYKLVMEHVLRYPDSVLITFISVSRLNDDE